MQRLAIITTHPIQYNAPWFKLLNERGIISLKVFYTWGEGAMQKKYDPGFNQSIAWDIPLLDGYNYTFVKNIAAVPGSHHYGGIDNPTLVKEIEEWLPTAILVIGWKFKSHLKVLRHFKGSKKLLFRGDSHLLDEAPGFGIRKTARQICLSWVYSYVDLAMYVGTANKQYYLAYGLKKSQLVFAPHAVDNNRFGQQACSRQRDGTEAANDTIVFIFVGKFEPKKNPQLLLDAFIKLADNRARLLMVGSGELEHKLKLKASQQPADVRGRIRFLPFQNQQQIPGVYKSADVFVLPSQGPGESWGLAVNEAMACSKAVLVSDKCGCAADLVVDGANGYVFKSGDVGHLLEKMKLMMASRNQVIQMGRHSLQAIAPWSFNNICNAIEQCLP